MCGLKRILMAIQVPFYQLSPEMRTWHGINISIAKLGVKINVVRGEWSKLLLFVNTVFYRDYAHAPYNCKSAKNIMG